MTGLHNRMKLAMFTLAVAGMTFCPALAGGQTVENKAAKETSDRPDFWNRPKLTGDWGGARTWLTDHGLSVDAEYTGFGQWVSPGTGSDEFDGGGKGDLFFNVDSGKLGLWKGGGLRTHTEYRHGKLDQYAEGVLFPVNVGQALPLNARDEVTLTSLYLTQTIGKHATVMFGKINAVDLLAPNPFYGGWGTRRFMNITLVAPPTGLVPPVMMGGIVSLRTDPINWTLMIYDPNDRTSDYWPDNLFSDGVNINLSTTYSHKLAGRTTTYGIGGIYSTKEGADLRDSLLPPDLVTTSKKGSYNVNFQFTHFLREYQNRPGDGWGIFFRGGVSDGNPNPIYNYVSGGIGGRQPFSGRPNDSFGIGYFYYNFSDELKNGLRPEVDFGDEQGGEVFYDFAITPWFHVTGDLQFIAPATVGVGTTVVGNLRGNLRF